MRKFRFHKHFRLGVMVTFLVLGSLVAGGLLYLGVVIHKIDTRIEQLRAAKGTQFFALYPALQPGQSFTLAELKAYLEDQSYREKKSPDEVLASEFNLSREEDRLWLTVHRNSFSGAGFNLDSARVKIRLEPDTEVRRFRLEEITAENGSPLERFESPPKKIGAFFAGRLRTQSSVPLSDIPVNVRYAVMAIEDVNFLEHPGISFRALLRALWRDLRAGRWVEGGSTITQQLMKNLFFSGEKALSRKVKEAVFAFVTEASHSKEAILEAYLNEVYLGQWATHQIHGVSEGARYYFNRDIADISLAQSATLAAIIQAPNVHDPRRHPEKVIKRRNTVLERMLKAGFILPEEYQTAVAEKLTVVAADRSLEDADYFTDLVMERLPARLKSELDKQSLTLYTTLNPYLQSTASRVLRANIERLRKLSPAIEKKAQKNIRLQGALIAVDVRGCSVLALQGGISYRQTQFNRALQGKRQPGSLFKPFVFLTAFDKGINGVPISPLTELEDTPFEWKYDAQIWKPKNYDNTYRERVTAREALEQSLNIPTARLASLVGVSPIVETLANAGITSPLPVVPSISLGSAEVTPMEIAQAYTTLANLGKSCTLRAFTRIFDENGNLVHEEPREELERLSDRASFQTISLLKGVFTDGTAKWVQDLGFPLQNFAGKTGTTNENKDAWFVGFSPDILVVVWMGYDEEAKIGLTGAAASLPLWVDFVRAARPFLGQEDFTVPESLVNLDIDPQSRLLAHSRCPARKVEYFVKGTEPQQLCPLH